MREKKNNWKDFVLGVVIMALLVALAVPALATTGKKQLEVDYMYIYLTVDGLPAEVSSNGKQPFVCEGTTYLPVRAVGEALGMDVRWDGPTHTVYITDPDPATSNMAATNNKTSSEMDTGKETIEVDYLDIKLVVNGKEVTPKDANGKVVEPFAYNGTTYLPVRAVGEALGKTVRWDGETKTVFLGEMPQGTYLVDACKVNRKSASSVYRAADHKAFTFATDRGGDGKRYSQGVLPATDMVTFELGGKYESLTFDYLNFADDWYDLTIYLDGEKAQTVERLEDGGMQTVTVPLNYAQTISFSAWSGSRFIANAVLHGERTVTKPVPPENATYLVDVCTVDGGRTYKAAEEEYCYDTFGNAYTNGIREDCLVQLNGHYKTLKGTVVATPPPSFSTSDLTKWKCEISVDGEIVKEIEISPAMGPQTIEIPLNYGMELRTNNISHNTRKEKQVLLVDAILE